MQMTTNNAARKHIETMTVARAYSRRHDFALAELTLYDAPDLTASANRIEFRADTLQVGAGQIHYHVSLIAPDGTVREGILAHHEQVFFEAPGFVPLSQAEWKAGPPPEKIALMRCLLTSKSLFQWTGRWVEQRVIEVEREVANGLLEPELLAELETLAEVGTVVLSNQSAAATPEGQRIGCLALLYMVGLVDQHETEGVTLWRINDKGRDFLQTRGSRV